MRDDRNRKRSRNLAACGATALLVGALGMAGPARAAELTVNSAGTLGDAVAGDGLCATGALVPLPGGIALECTLRAAVEEANAVPGPDRI